MKKCEKKNQYHKNISSINGKLCNASYRLCKINRRVKSRYDKGRD